MSNKCDIGDVSVIFCQLHSFPQVFRRWDMALYSEAMTVKNVSKQDFSARCESIASEIFPVEQQVLNEV